MRVNHLLDQGIGRLNEDAIFLGARRFGVFDGASSLDGYADEQGRTGGYLASHIVQNTFETFAGSLVETSLEANRRIGAAMAAGNIDPGRKEGLWCSTMAIVEIDIANEKLEWAQIADSLIVAIGRDGTHEALIRDDYDHDRGVMQRWNELARKRIENIRVELNDDIVRLRRTANVNYGVLNGDPSAAKFLRTGSASLHDVAHVLLFTDGMIPPKRDPAAADDFSAIVAAFLDGGLALVRDRIRAVENGDPHCWDYPRYKKSDDIAAIAISFD